MQKRGKRERERGVLALQSKLKNNSKFKIYLSFFHNNNKVARALVQATLKILSGEVELASVEELNACLSLEGGVGGKKNNVTQSINFTSHAQ